MKGPFGIWICRCDACVERREKRIRKVIMILLLALIYVVLACIFLSYPSNAAPLKCVDMDGREARCIAVYETAPSNTLRMVLFIDSFE